MKRIYSLDFLKFLMALLIVSLHFQQEYSGGFLATAKFHIWYAVDLFFIISGFFSISSLKKINEPDISQTFSSYFIPKCFRIYPMAMLSVIAYYVLSFAFRICCGSWFRNLVPSLWKLLNSLLLTKGGPIIFDVPFNYPLWYLGVLLICYCIAFLLFRLAKNKKISITILYIIMVLFGLSIYCNDINFPYFNCLSARGYTAFFLGGALNIFYYKCENLRKKALVLSIISVLVCISAGLINFDLFYADEFCQWGTCTFILAPSFLIIFLEIDKWFKSEKWSFFGGIAYEIYLWHVPLLLILFCMQKKLSIMSKIQVSFQMAGFIFFVIVFSAVMYKFVEIPLGRKLNSLFEKYTNKGNSCY